MVETTGNEYIIIPEDGDDALKIADLNLDAASILISLQNLKIAIKGIEGHVKHYQKETVRFIRSLKKNQKNRSVKTNVDGEKKEREPTGFAKKTKIRKELMDFLSRPDVKHIIDIIMSEEDLKPNSKFEPLDEEQMINRPSATKIINRYIKEKGLQGETCKVSFNPDDALKKILLPCEKADKQKGGYKFFNLQKYIKHLFISL